MNTAYEMKRHSRAIDLADGNGGKQGSFKNTIHARAGVVETPQQVPVMVADRLQTYRTYDVALVAPD